MKKEINKFLYFYRFLATDFMLCPKCNHELDKDGICPNCYHVEVVHTMSNREANNYNGITIEEENNQQKEYYQEPSYNYKNYQQRGPYGRHNGNCHGNGIRFRYINLNNNSSSWLTRSLIAVGGFAILGFFFFVALPVLLTILGAGIVAWFIFRFFKR